MTTTTPHRVALSAARTGLKAAFLERDEAIDAVLTAMIAGEHTLLLGPPGTAKSLLARGVKTTLDCSYFEILMTRFTTPEEVFGPVSLAGLQQDQIRRLTKGKAAESEVLFLDEIFKSNSAILNALLTLLNENVFHNNGVPVPCPLVTCIGASNELPDGPELDALFDRFLVRVWVGYVVDSKSMRALFTGANIGQVAKGLITRADLATIRAEVQQVTVGKDVIDGLLKLKADLESKGFRVSDRRWRKLIGLLKARAYLEGESAVAEDHFECLTDALWREPKERMDIAKSVSLVGNPASVRATELLDAAKQALQGLTPPPAATDPDFTNKRNEWVKAASTVESKLGGMATEVEALIAKHTGRNIRRLNEAKSTIVGKKLEIRAQVAQAFQIGA
jgi:MoxR-like ATPase